MDKYTLVVHFVGRPGKGLTDAAERLARRLERAGFRGEVMEGQEPGDDDIDRKVWVPFGPKEVEHRG